MIRGNAGLPGIESFSPDQATCCDLQISPRENDGWVLAAEFQGHWCEIGRCSFQDLGSDPATSGEKNVVKPQSHQIGCD